jgi:hypothetical protein
MRHIFIRKAWNKRPFGRPKARWEDNMEMFFKRNRACVRLIWFMIAAVESCEQIYWTAGSHKTGGISRLVEWLLAAEESAHQFHYAVCVLADLILGYCLNWTSKCPCKCMQVLRPRIVERAAVPIGKHDLGQMTKEVAVVYFKVLSRHLPGRPE